MEKTYYAYSISSSCIRIGVEFRVENAKVSIVGASLDESIPCFLACPARGVARNLYVGLSCEAQLQERKTDMGMLRVMSRRGDDRIVWDLKKAETNDPEAAAAIREAERIFNEERSRGATAFKVEDGKPVERIEKFDKTAEQIVIVPRVVGG